MVSVPDPAVQSPPVESPFDASIASRSEQTWSFVCPSFPGTAVIVAAPAGAASMSAARTAPAVVADKRKVQPSSDESTPAPGARGNFESALQYNLHALLGRVAGRVLDRQHELQRDLLLLGERLLRLLRELEDELVLARLLDRELARGRRAEGGGGAAELVRAEGADVALLEGGAQLLLGEQELDAWWC